MSSSLIADALFTKTQQRVLGLLYGRPDKTFYTTEIMRSAKIGRGTISRELDRLALSGLINVSKQGNQRHYQAKADNPVFDELVSIIKKTFGLADVIRAALLPVTEQINWAFIYGSIAKGEATSASDVDLMVVSPSLAYTEIMALLPEAEQTINRPINPSIYTAEQIKQKMQANNVFVSRVMQQNKIWIKGSEDDIRNSE
jgi:predicted nucleotidyltransferase